MQLATLLVGGLLVAGLAVTVDDPHAALVKLLHGGPQGHREIASRLDDHADTAALRVLHDSVGALDLDAERRARLHERMVRHATPVHEALMQLVSARDAHVRAVLAVPFDPEALGAAGRDLAEARQSLATATAALHAELRASLDEAELVALDAAREARLTELEAGHAELLEQLLTEASRAHAPHGR
jgi:hypothetical protein